MAKMFYTLEEAAEKLGKGEDEVRELASSGRIQEFRDREKLMFKVDQVDLLAAQEDGGDADDEFSLDSDMSGMLPLGGDTSSGGGGDSIGLASSGSVALDTDDFTDEDEADAAKSGAPEKQDSGSMIGIEPADTAAGSGSGIALDDAGSSGGSGEQDAKQKTGVSIFDADELDTADPAAATLMTDDAGLDEISADQVGSGSGLMELTRESDDTSLGADAFLEELGSAEDSGGAPAPSATGLFEGTSGDEEPALVGSAPTGGAVAAQPEIYDGAWSGLTGGMAFGMILSLAMALAVIITSMMGADTEDFIDLVSGNLLIWIGALAGITIVAALLGLILGKRG